MSLKMTPSKGSVYRDLGFEKPEEWEAKATIAAEIIAIIQEKGWNQKQAAEFLGTQQTEISNIRRGQFDRFTLDRLVSYSRKLGTHVDITLRRDPQMQEGHLAVICA